MLVNLQSRGYTFKKLHINDQQGRKGNSGINATVFGGSSTLGMMVGTNLTRIGSTCIYPYRKSGSIMSEQFRELKPVADMAHKAYVHLKDFSKQSEIDWVIRDQNTVVNCIGSKIFYQKDADFEEANIRIPMAIARSCAKNPNVKRFIHISAAGADPNSHSQRLRTKWIGEQEVKAIYPDVTILRPTYMFNIWEPNLTIAAKWGMQMKMFNRMQFVIAGITNTEFQPTYVNDVALAVVNAIKMQESAG